MRHRVHKVQLSRDYDHKRALLKNMSVSLIENGKIETTVAKAKALRPYIEKLVTKAKRGGGFNVVKYLRTKLLTESSIKKLIEEVAPKYKDINGGYTRIVRTRTREGDKSEMARIEFVSLKKAEKKGKSEAEESKTKETKPRAKKITAKKPAREPETTEEKVEEKVEETKDNEQE